MLLSFHSFSWLRHPDTQIKSSVFFWVPYNTLGKSHRLELFYNNGFSRRDAFGITRWINAELWVECHRHDSYQHQILIILCTVPLALLVTPPHFQRTEVRCYKINRGYASSSFNYFRLFFCKGHLRPNYPIYLSKGFNGFFHFYGKVSKSGEYAIYTRQAPIHQVNNSGVSF